MVCPEDANTGVKKIFADQSYYDTKVETQAWTSRTTFILASIGCAVGVGNIWRFPYMCYRNGGAAFMIPYVISITTLGYPLFVLETALGQGTGKSPVGALGTLCPRLKGLAWLGFSANACITCYYMVVLSWALKYLIASCTMGTPEFAIEGNAPYYFQHVMLDKRYFCTWPSKETSPPPDAERYDVRSVEWQDRDRAMEMGYSCENAGFLDEGSLNMEQVSLFLVVWGIVLSMVFMGTKSLKYSIYVTLPLPYVVIVIMFFRGVTLEGAGEGLKYYLTPKIDILFNDRQELNSQGEPTGKVLPAVNIWLSAASHIFYSLGLGQGMLITYSSYNPSHYPIQANSLIVSAANSLTEIFGGFATFSILGYLAKKKGVTVDEVVAGGPGLVFESLPEAFGLMPAPAFFAFLFFFMLLLLGISSAIGMFESIVCTIRNQLTDMSSTSKMAERMVSRHWILPILCSILIGVPGLLFCRRSAEHWIDLVDGTVSFFLLSLIGVGEFLAVSWVFGIKNFRTVIQHRCGYRPDAFLAFVWTYWGPALLLALFLFGIAGAVESPVTNVPWALCVGWLLAIIPLVFSIQYYLRHPNHDGEHLSVHGLMQRPKTNFSDSTPSYIRAPFRIVAFFTALGKDKMDVSVSTRGAEMTELGPNSGGGAQEDLQHEKRNQSNPLLDRAGV